MSLEPGDRLGNYEILSTLGAGGMGVVYRARDTTLGRDVAIKVLPDEVAAEPDRLARFDREARVLASLSHPSIAVLYGFERADDIHFLAMELVGGETLEERIARGPIPVEVALRLFIGIAEGLEAAHAKGVIHRDLKPANVKIGSGEGSGQTKSPAVKILDFGLAKALAVDEAAGGAELSHSPTLTLAATARGEILGTAAYMAPEQAQGEPADARADIWAFGVCLFEALTGERVFDGSNHSFVLASVLKDEPDFDALPAATPPQVRRLLRRCLEKDRDRRLHDMADVRLELEEALTMPEDAEAEAAAGPGRRSSRLWIGLAAAAGLVLGGLLASLAGPLLRSAPEPPPITRFVLNAPPNVPVGLTPGNGLAISRDGRNVVYLAGNFPATEARLRRVEQLESTPLLNEIAGGVLMPFFSPDGKRVAYFNGQRQVLRKVSVLGGPSATVCEIDQFPAGGSWGEDDTIVIGQDTGALLRVAAAGGEPQELTQLEEGELAHRFPHVLPDGNVLFAAFTGADSSSAVIKVVSPASGEQRALLAGTQPGYVASGHLVYAVGANLWAVPFDPRSLQTLGDPVPVVEGVVTTGYGGAKYAVSAQGTLVYTAGGEQARENVLVWVDREGEEEPIATPPRFYVYPRLSPDGTKIALDVRAEEEDIWIWDVERETLTRLTFSPETDAGPLWSPDGSTVFFGSAQEDGGWDIFSRLADGTGALTRLTEQPGLEAPASITPDGSGLIAISGATATGPFDILLVDTQGSSEPQTLLEADFNLANAELSPDGRWLAYESDESGASEIFVRPFPDLDAGRWQVSTGGGTRPLWSRDGSEIFYLSPSESLMAATVESRGDAIAFGRPQTLIEESYANPRTGRTYDVSPDGRRFLMIKSRVEQDGDAGGKIVVVQNWHDELERQAPARSGSSS